MKIVCAILLLCSAAASQGQAVQQSSEPMLHFSGMAVDKTGAPIVGAAVSVCAQKKNSCPMETLYLGHDGKMFAANPVIADAFGNYGFYWRGEKLLKLRVTSPANGESVTFNTGFIEPTQKKAKAGAHSETVGKPATEKP